MTRWICTALDHLPASADDYAATYGWYRCLCGAIYNVPKTAGIVAHGYSVKVRFR